MTSKNKTNEQQPSLPTRKYPRRQSVGECPMCKRLVHLTFHHLIPKKMHRRTFFKKHYTKQSLAEGVDVCRLCHNGIHATYSEMELAKHYNTPEKLQQCRQLSAHFEWASKQKRSIK